MSPKSAAPDSSPARQAAGGSTIRLDSSAGRIVASDGLFGDADELLLDHNGEIYLLHKLPDGSLALRALAVTGKAAK